MQRHKVKSKLALTMVAITIVLPISAMVACTTPLEENLKNQNIISAFSHHADILMKMKITPKYIADEGMGAKTPYLDKLPGYEKIEKIKQINTFNELDAIEMIKLKNKANTIFGSFGIGGSKKLADYFENIINLGSTKPYTGKDAESLLMKLNNKDIEKTKIEFGMDVNYTSELNIPVDNIYINWIEAAKKLDEIFYQKDEDKSNDHKLTNIMNDVVTQTKTRIKKLRDKLGPKIKNKSLLIYNWGGRFSPEGPVETDFNNTGWYQGPILPNAANGSIFYSKKNGLGFGLPKFASGHEVYISNNKWPEIKSLANENTSLRAALKNQNDYVIFAKQLYENEITSETNVKETFGPFVKDYSSNLNNLKWFKDASLGTAAYGPHGVNYILDWVADQWKI